MNITTIRYNTRFFLGCLAPSAWKNYPMPKEATVMSEPMRVLVLTAPKHAAHYRTTHLGSSQAPIAYLEMTQPWHASHDHHFSELTRFGDATCHGCGVFAWAPGWVAAGVYGENTQEWLDEREQRMHSLMEVGVLANLKAASTVIVADHNIDQPANVDHLQGRRGSVPPMPLNLTGIPSVNPAYDHNL